MEYSPADLARLVSLGGFIKEVIEREAEMSYPCIALEIAGKDYKPDHPEYWKVVEEITEEELEMNDILGVWDEEV